MTFPSNSKPKFNLSLTLLWLFFIFGCPEILRNRQSVEETVTPLQPAETQHRRPTETGLLTSARLFNDWLVSLFSDKAGMKC